MHASPAPTLSLTGAEVIFPDGLRRADIGVEQGRIAAPRTGRVLDLSGYILAPGIVDIHGDGFERHVAPRRGVLPDPALGLDGLDAELLTNGITTAVLAQFISWEGGMRGPEFCRRVTDALKSTPLDTNIVLQIRLERFFPEGYTLARALIESGQCGYLVFNDHLPHAAIKAGKRPPRLTGQALKAARNPETHLALIKTLCARAAQGPLPEEADLIALAQAHDVPLGSHDDPDQRTRHLWQERGVGIAEFPESFDAIDAASERGNPVVLGAPNLLRGASHAGKISARDAILRGGVDALASDYFYPAPLAAAFLMQDLGLKSLDQGWKMISETPARILGLSDRGHISEGARADLVVINKQRRRIDACFIGGQLVYARRNLAAGLTATDNAESLTVRPKAISLSR